MDSGPVRMDTSCKELVLVLNVLLGYQLCLCVSVQIARTTLLMSTYHVLGTGDA